MNFICIELLLPENYWELPIQPTLFGTEDTYVIYSDIPVPIKPVQWWNMGKFEKKISKNDLIFRRFISNNGTPQARFFPKNNLFSKFTTFFQL